GGEPPEVRPREAPRALERFVHHELSRAGREGRARHLGVQARLHDDDPQLYERSADPRPAAQGPAPRAGRRAEHHPDDHRRRQGDGPRHSGSAGEDRRHLAARAHARRVRRGADGGSREEDDHRGSERRLQAGGPLEPQGHPRGERRAARVDGLHRQFLLQRRGCAFDVRARRDVPARVVVVRQRDGLLRPLRRSAGLHRGKVSKRSLRDLPAAALDGRRALVRVDFNVPLKGGAVSDDTRIRAAVPTIAYLRDKGVRVVLLSHLGRPSRPDPNLSLKQIVRDVERVLGTPVEFIPDPAAGVAATRRLPRGGVALVENTRFWPGEEANDAGFAQTLAALGDFYVDDAFGSAHRAHASTEAVAHLLKPAVAGFLMERELTYLGDALDHPKRPFVGVLGWHRVWPARPSGGTRRPTGSPRIAPSSTSIWPRATTSGHASSKPRRSSGTARWACSKPRPSTRARGPSPRRWSRPGSAAP